MKNLLLSPKFFWLMLVLLTVPPVLIVFGANFLAGIIAKFIVGGVKLVLP